MNTLVASNDGEQVVLDFMKAFQSGEYPSLGRYVHADAVFELPHSMLGTIKGLKKWADWHSTAIPEVFDTSYQGRANISDLASSHDGSVVYISLKVDMRFKTGKPYDNLYIIKATVENNKIARLVFVTDTLMSSQRLGYTRMLPEDSPLLAD